MILFVIQIVGILLFWYFVLYFSRLLLRKNVEKCSNGWLVEWFDGHVIDLIDTSSTIIIQHSGYSCNTITLFSITFLQGHFDFVNFYPSSIVGGKYSIVGIRDLTNGYDNTKPDNKTTLPISKSSEMITFTFDNGLVATLRTSGTEPKIKYYIELCASPELQDIDALNITLREMVDAIVKDFLRPELNGLTDRTF